MDRYPIDTASSPALCKQSGNCPQAGARLLSVNTRWEHKDFLNSQLDVKAFRIKFFFLLRTWWRLHAVRLAQGTTRAEEAGTRVGLGHGQVQRSSEPA